MGYDMHRQKNQELMNSISNLKKMSFLKPIGHSKNECPMPLSTFHRVSTLL